MKIEETEKIGRLYFEEMWSKPDFIIADEIIDPKYNPSWIHIDKVGPAQIKHEITYFRTIFPDLVYEVVEIRGEEDKVWIRYRGHGTHLGKGWGFDPTEKKVSFEGATILYFNPESKIIDRWGAFCFYDILYDLGVVPSLWELHKYCSGIY
ncbi:MAG: ester cyclase [Candidatus Lokiarchaeota archaeon]|nr:ester cyclase [Candidatus Lokiarchaeota archaeon]